MSIPKIDPEYPDRPQHPDFWALSEVVKSLDGVAEAGESMEDVLAGANFDFRSMLYMAQQRALRAEAIFATSDAPPQAKFTAQWIDGFVAGLMVGDKRSTIESEQLLSGELDDGNRRQGEKS